jgi:ABC-type multidrug transport system fused ATPase/permease subunit
VLFSHRLAAFSEADMVVVLTHGTIEERGTHQELLQTGGLYSRIYRAQLQIERGAASGALAR